MINVRAAWTIQWPWKVDMTKFSNFFFCAMTMQQMTKTKHPDQELQIVNDYDYLNLITFRLYYQF